jgi:S1-C subfamily serine protease
MKINSLTMVLLLVLSFCSCAATHDVKGLYNEVNRSVGVIFTIQRAPSPERGGQLTQFAGLGSGVLISADGKMVTAAHVVQAADTVFVRFGDGEKVTAKVITSAPQADLALIQLTKVPSFAKPAPLGDSGKIAVGDQICVIGAPYGIEHVLTVGYISARHRPNKVLKNFEMGEFFQTDAAINQGNSGGPMFSMDGEVVGIVSSNLTFSGGFEGIGFAVTSNTAKRLLIDEPTPWSGVEGVLLTGDLAKAFNLPQSAGMLVERVAAGSLGNELKLKGGTINAQVSGQPLVMGGDIVLSVQDMEVKDTVANTQGIRKAMSAVPVGGEIRVVVYRGGKKVSLSAARKY